MKRIAFVLLITVLALSLTACRVNWFDRHYDVPWWSIAVPIVVFDAIVCLAAVK